MCVTRLGTQAAEHYYATRIGFLPAVTFPGVNGHTFSASGRKRRSGLRGVPPDAERETLMVK